MTKIFLSALFLLAFCSVAGAGAIEVITLTDITGERDTALLIGATEAQLKKFVPSGKLQNQIAAFLVKFEGQEILFDAGLRDGHVVNELVKNGAAPEKIKFVVLTHLHGDHFGGLVTPEGKAAFPEAEIFIAKPEKIFWADEKKNEAVLEALSLYEGRVKLFDFGDEILPGVKAIDTTGHTPGHTSFLIESSGEKFLILGDIIHFVDIQLPVPEVAVTYDTDPVKAVQSRKFILDYAAQKEIPVAGMHIKGSGILKIKKSGEGYENF